MDAFQIYNFGTAGYMTLQALPLLLTPSMIVSMLAAEPRRITDVETYLSRSSALLLLAFAALNLLLTGVLPVANSWDEVPSASNGKDSLAKNPYAFPTVIVTTTYHALTAFYIYMQITYRGSFGFYSGLILSTSLFCMGVWVCVFGGEKPRMSKTTGADKRTANFPFVNKESAKSIKKEEKESKKEEKEKDKDRSKRRSMARTLSGR